GIRGAMAGRSRSDEPGGRKPLRSLSGSCAASGGAAAAGGDNGTAVLRAGASMKRQGVLLLCALFGAGALSGCESRPRPPLYSSAQATGSFGYFEEQLGKDRLRVGYRAPLRRDSTTSQG